MSAASPPQVGDINSAIDAVQAYIDTLQTALSAAANAGNMSAGTAIESRFLDANSLEEKLVGLLTVTDIASLQASVKAVSTTTSVLQMQTAQINNLVTQVGVAAGVLGEIASIAAAVAQLVAVV
jgi:hypothetical protein